MTIITLTRPGTCRDCGATLPVGSRAKRYRYGVLYGLNCHTRATGEPLGQTLSRLDPKGFYTADGRKLGSMACGHEDYPCCGC